MITIDAHWELRNLGVSSNEYLIEDNDDERSLLGLNGSGAAYQVVKLPLQKKELIFPLQKQGFVFVEQLYECSHNLILPDLTSPMQKIISAISLEEICGHSLDLIKREIRSGMFNSDRVAIDNEFGLECSANRYIGWVDDLIVAGAATFLMIYRRVPVGFFILKKDGDLCDAVLGGIFNKYKNAGFGVALNYLELKVAQIAGCSTLRGVISSNNLPIFRINNILGYAMIPKYYVFIRHAS